MSGGNEKPLARYDFSDMIADMEQKTAFLSVVEKLGSQARLAELIGKRPSTVAYWANTGIPAEAAVALERATDGDIPRWVSRPDLWEVPSDAEAAE